MTNTKKKAAMKKTKSKPAESKTPATKPHAKTMKMQPTRKKTSKGAGKTKTKATKATNTVMSDTCVGVCVCYVLIFFFFGEPEIFTTIFHHGCELVNENNKRFYRGGVQTIVSGEKLEDWSKSHVFNLVRGWRYAENSFRLWTIFDNFYDGAMWKLREDDDYLEVIATFIVGSGRDAPIFVEHLVENENNPDVDEYDSDYAKGVKFYDSEDERTVGLNDGFGSVADERIKNENNMRIVVSSIWCSETNTNFEDGDYESEELNSSDPDASDEERGLRYEKFRKKQMGKTYKPRFGMEFTCLQDFRDATRYWNVRNGYELRWVKNEGDKVRVVCARGCPYRVLCSQVGQEITFAIKTPEEQMVHKCVKSLTNKSANSKWVSKSVVQLKHTTQKVRLKDIQQHMRTHFSLNINPSTAWKAKQYETAIIEGDLDRQYALLRRYGDELIRVCKQNTVKIGVERPIGSLHPRFASFYFCFDGSLANLVIKEILNKNLLFQNNYVSFIGVVAADMS
ncbi:hypothetical protein QL285_004115 [Trifolium repens]|nr:hypothetical protein QL285_004115 [Trifolium repens]